MKKTLRDIMIYDHTDKMGNTSLTMADSGLMEITPTNGSWCSPCSTAVTISRIWTERPWLRGPSGRPPSARASTGSIFPLFDGSHRRDLFRKNYQMLNIRQLEEATDSLHRQLSDKVTEFVKNFNTNYSHFHYKYDTLAVPDTAADSVYQWNAAFLDPVSPGPRRYASLRMH